ncbi:hypothetical protein ABKN59_004772 [Abortiporus biennis]
MSQTSAADLKTKGNELFKAGKHAQAASLYTKAEEADSKDPVYPSNLSAALYEQGLYSKAIDAILCSWNLIQSSSDNKPDLVHKLSLRLVKALAQGTDGQSIVDDFVKSRKTDIAMLEETSLAYTTANPSITGADDLRKAWRTWELGHDDPFLLLDRWSLTPYPLKLKALSAEALSKLAFLYSGCGDGRHAFTTVIHLNHVKATLTKTQQKAFRAHLTLNDIHPVIMARVLILLMMTNDLAEGSYEDVEKIELQASITYTFLGGIVLPYVAERQWNITKNLHEHLSRIPPKLPLWLFVPSGTIPPVSEELDHSGKPRNPSMADLLKMPGITPEMQRNIEAHLMKEWKRHAFFLNDVDILKCLEILDLKIFTREAKKYVQEH